MNTKIENAVITGGAKASTLIYNSLISSGAIIPSKAIHEEMARIIVKSIIAEIQHAEKGSEE